VLPRGNAGPFLWLRNPASSPYIGTMPKPMELPPAVARRFVEDMRAFHAEPNAIKRDEVAAQFCLSANEHGRVHGIIIDDTFYVIWLDHDHRLYP
jgi:hypothetical protein